jgi:hypothetical protein
MAKKKAKKEKIEKPSNADLILRIAALEVRLDNLITALKHSKPLKGL